jgi:hypothetical protein
LAAFIDRGGNILVAFQRLGRYRNHPHERGEVAENRLMRLENNY